MTDMIVMVSKLEVSLCLQLQRAEQSVVRYRDQTTTETVYRFHGPKHILRGCAAPLGSNIPPEYRPANLVADGTAALSQIPLDFAEQWISQNALHPAVKAGLIYISKHSDATGAAREKTDVRCGMQPLSPPLVDERTGEPVGKVDARWPKKRTISTMFIGPDAEISGSADLNQ